MDRAGISFRNTSVPCRVIPVVFRTPRSLSRLNIASVGLAIAAMTTAAFMWGSPGQKGSWPIIVGLPSLVVGMVWATMLRRRETVANGVPVGWVLSVPLAAFNGSLACGLLMFLDSPQAMSFLGGAVLGATFGVVLWAPGLLMVLVLFGLPIARARKLARSGLAGEDRGEAWVGLTSTVVAALALALPHGSMSPFAATLFYALSVLAAVTGSSAAVLAFKRERRRRRFVARVEADEVPGFRVEPRAVGKVLVRVDPKVETYRIAPHPDEELFQLDAEGRVMRAMS
jgi:hypothetical protein